MHFWTMSVDHKNNWALNGEIENREIFQVFQQLHLQYIHVEAEHSKTTKRLRNRNAINFQFSCFSAYLSDLENLPVDN